MRIKIDDFEGMIPRITPRNLPSQNSVFAKHCHMRRGRLEPLIAPKLIATYDPTNIYPALKSMYWFNSITDPTKGALLGTTSIANIVLSPTVGDVFKRLYITDDDPAIVPLLSSEYMITPTQNIDLSNVVPVGINGNTWGVGQIITYPLKVPPPASAPLSAVVPVPVGDALSITMTDPVVVTVGSAGVPISHGLVTGDRITISGSASVPDLDGIWAVTVVSDTEVELDGSLGSTWTGTYVASEASGHRYWDILETDSRSYIYTYITSLGEESAPSLASSVVDVGPRQGVSITGMVDSPQYATEPKRYQGPAQIPAYGSAYVKRLYRTNNGDYQFVADIPFGTTVYSDTIESSLLGDIAPSVDWDVPPDDLHALIMHPNGFLVGLSGHDLCFSEAGHPHAWPIKYRMKLDWLGVGLGAYGTSIACMTDGYPEVATGTHPSAMVKEKVEIYQACTSSRSIADAGYSIIYSSPDGLVSIGVGANGIVTSNLHTKQQWEAVNPSTIRSAYYDDKYYCFFNSSISVPVASGQPTSTYQGVVVDLRHEADGIVMTDQQVDCAYYDQKTDNLFLSVGGNSIYLLERDVTNMAMEWRSKHFFLPNHINFGAAVVHSESYANTTFELWAVDTSETWVIIHTQTVANNIPFRLPSGVLYQEFMLILKGTDVVVMMAIAETMAELRTI